MFTGFPFFRSPYNRYYYPSFRNYHISRAPAPLINCEEKTVNDVLQTEASTKSQDEDSFERDDNLKRNRDEKETPIFEILGISLFLDDLIILCLLFFLYTEGVQDEFLFISLILLLLS